MLPVYDIDGVDFRDTVLATGFGWARNDLEDDKAGRTRDGLMHRKRLAQKRKLTIKCPDLPYSRLHELCVALRPEYIQLRILDPDLGIVTKTFYGTAISATTSMVKDGESWWSGTSYELVER